MKLFLLLTLVAFAASKPSSTGCPSVCNCSKFLEAECSTLDIKQPFGIVITTLKIINPKEKLTFKAGTFKNLGLDNLSKLFIENATITKFDSKTFEGLPLTHLFIRKSVIPEIPIDVFEPLPNLSIIDFTQSNLINFSEIRSNSVEEIQLSGCNLRDIPESMFKHCPQLSYLNLEHNNLKNFKISKYAGLFEINLSNNKLSEFDLTELNNLTENFVTLILSHNPNLKLKNYELSNNNVEKLVLQGCNLKDIDFISAFPVLTELDLSDNQITKLNENAFKKLIELEKLDLSNNKIEAISDGIFSENTRLDRIVLDKNHFKTLPKFTTNYLELKMEYFSCKMCGISVLDPKTFEKALSLRILILSHNQLESIPSNFFKVIRSLQEIDLSHNHLKQLDKDSFVANPDLTKVTLAGNPLQEINVNLFRKNNDLRHLDVSSCELKELWIGEEKMSMPNSLRTIVAENNKIQVITKDQLKHAKNLEVIQLNRNPLRCAKTLRDTITFLRNKFASKQYEQINSWLNICDDELSSYYIDDYFINKDVDEDQDIESENENENADNENDLDYKYPLAAYTDDEEDEDRQFFSDAEDVIAMDSVRFTKARTHGEIIVFLLPTLVFVLTALIVLIVTVVSILFILHKRNAKNSNLPKINIIPWSNSNKMKKHSGSVYRPLSEKLPEI